MSNIPITVLSWLPILFDWAIVPAAIILIGLCARPETRPMAATGFLIAAGISAGVLSLLLAASVFYLIGYGRAVGDLLLNFGPTVTSQYIGTLMRQNGMRLLTLLPMVATALSSTIAAIYLRRLQSPE